MKYDKDFYNEENTFERYLELERKRQVILSSEKCKHVSILDVGASLLTYYKHIEGWSRYTIIDPNNEPTGKIPASVTLINSTLEESGLEEQFDFIILSSVLHLVHDYNKFLAEIKKLCHNDTLIHINVPNAQSLHRLLGYRMGMLANMYDKSAKDIEYEHQTVFTLHGLIYALNDNGFLQTYTNTYMLKPFSDKQMSLIINPDVANGLVRMTRDFNKSGCEIVVEAKCIKN